MSISITKLNIFFNNQKNLIIIFKTSSENINVKKRNNFIFIYSNKSLIGINVFNYDKEFNNIEEGYHDFSDENFNKIIAKYPKEMENVKNSFFLKIGLIKKIIEHPKNNKLKILTVKTKEEKLTIITNLINLKTENKYLFSTNGGFLATGLVIKNSKIMGIESQGMICSYKSIGINKEGIILIDNQDIIEKYIF